MNKLVTAIARTMSLEETVTSANQNITDCPKMMLKVVNHVTVTLEEHTIIIATYSRDNVSVDQILKEGSVTMSLMAFSSEV